MSPHRIQEVEYRVETIDAGTDSKEVEAGLNTLGKDGWRLACTLPTGIESTTVRSGSMRTELMQLVFMRFV